MSFEVDGEIQLSRSLDLLVKDIPDLKDFFKETVTLIDERSDKLFAKKGKNVKKGKKWKDLAKSTKYARKKRYGYYKQAPDNPSVLRWTGNLQDSKKKKYTDDYGSLEYTAKYAIYHHKGNDNLPERSLIDLSNDVNAEIVRGLQKQLHNKFKIANIRI